MADFLYNGVRLPDISSVWDEANQDGKLEYALIFRTTEVPSGIAVYFTNRPWVYDGTQVWSGNYAYYTGRSYWPDSSEPWSNYGTGMSKLYLNPADVIWTSHDILNEDGTVFLAASDPIPVGGEPLDPTSLFLGWLVGRQIAGMRGKQPVIPDVPVEPDEPSGEIVGYLYNGVQLPDISTIYTDDVKTDYPYAVIQYIKAADTYQFIASEKEWYETYAGSNVFKTGGRYQYTLVDVAWGNKYVTSTNGATYDLNERDFVWTNTDIYYQNGTLLLAASDPIPVYA